MIVLSIRCNKVTKSVTRVCTHIYKKSVEWRIFMEGKIIYQFKKKCQTANINFAAHLYRKK